MPPRPPLLGRLLLRLADLGDRRDDALADLQELYERRIAAVSVRQARRRYVSDVWSLVGRPQRAWTSGLRSDARDAGRALRRTPAQTLSLFLCLFLGTTLTVVMFSVFNTVLAGELPGIEDRVRLLRVTRIQADLSGHDTGARGSLSLDAYRALPTRVPGTTGTAFQIESVFKTAAISGQPVRLRGQFVNGEFFTVLGTRAVLGRPLTPADDRPAAMPAAMIGYDFWVRQLGARQSVVGETLGVGPHLVTIVGVLPRGFAGISDIQIYDLGGGHRDAGDVWLPASLATWGRDGLVMNSSGAAGGKVVLRLAPAATGDDVRPGLARAVAALAASSQAQVRPQPDRQEMARPRPVGLDVEPFALTKEGTDSAELLGGISLVMATPLLVLFIACTNVAGVQFANALRRTPELATRIAVGATRGQVVRLIATEVGIVALAAACVSLFVSAQALRLAEGVIPVALSIDWRVFGFAAVITCGVTIVAGVWPSWKATGFRVLDGLRPGAGVGATLRVSRLRRATLALQIALSAALLGVSLHLGRALEAAPAALAPPVPNVLTATVRPLDVGMDDTERATAWLRLADALPALPGIEFVAMGSSLFAQDNWGSGDAQGHARSVTANWFAALDITVKAGRIPTADEPGALVVNEALARRFGGADVALGRVLHAGTTPTTIVGVVADSYERVAWGRPTAVGYRIVRPADTSLNGTVYLVGPGAEAAKKSVTSILAGIHPQLSPWEMGLVDDVVNSRFVVGRLVAMALSWMSVAALALAGVGLFGAIGLSATARTREFGVRLALGAGHRNIAGLVLRDVSILAGAGLTLGVLLGTAAISALRTALVTISPGDPVPTLVVTGGVALIAGCAVLAPLRRVLSIDPVATLKGDN